MKNKWPLFTGLALLTIGIVFKIVFENTLFAIFLIVTGIVLKLYFILSKIKSAKYRPGYELILLFVGLGLFFTGVHMERTFLIFEPLYVKFTGIILKIAFVLLFIQKTRNKDV